MQEVIKTYWETVESEQFKTLIHARQESESAPTPVITTIE